MAVNAPIHQEVPRFKSIEYHIGIRKSRGKKKTWRLGVPAFGGKVFEEQKVRANGMMNYE
ncbi:MAG: hypothetical protein NT166_07565 [Candidatus Aminicenantes bacterium]|nr:hypothetical protein [Candidatus Aminicenantes bacterium]